MNEVTKRFIETYKEMGLTGYQLGKMSQVITKQKISNIEKGISEASIDIIAEFTKLYDNVNAEYILTGKGQALKTEKEEVNVSKSNGLPITTEEAYREAAQQGMSLIPEVNFRFSAGQTQLICGTEEITRYWFLPDCKDCEGVVQMVGRSMSPTLPSGCWVALKRYSIPYNDPNAIPFGNIFGIVVEDSVTGEYHGHIKILRRHKDPEMAKRCWIAHSINTEEFDDFNIPIAQVRSLWLVKQHIVSDII